MVEKVSLLHFFNGRKTKITDYLHAIGVDSMEYQNAQMKFNF